MADYVLNIVLKSELILECDVEAGKVANQKCAQFIDHRISAINQAYDSVVKPRGENDVRYRMFSDVSEEDARSIL